MERSCLAQTKKIDRHALQKLGSVGVLSDNHINYAHISSFKGLEADIVFIIDTDKVKSYDEKLLYTQASRAKYKLYIFEKSEWYIIIDMDLKPKIDDNIGFHTE